MRTIIDSLYSKLHILSKHLHISKAETKLKGLNKLRRTAAELAISYVALFAIPTLVKFVFEVLNQGFSWYQLIRGAVICFGIVAFFLKKKISSQTLAYILIINGIVIGFIGLIALGPSPTRLIILCFSCVVAATISGAKVSLGAVLLSSATIVLAGWIRPYTSIPDSTLVMSKIPMSAWWSVAITFAIWTAPSCLLVAWIMRSLQRTILELRKREADLDQANTKLQALATELEEQAEDLDEQRIKAESSSRAKERFLNVVSHELKTPLNPILNFLKLAEDNQSIPTEIRSEVSLMKNSAEQLNRLVSRTVNYSEIEQGDFISNPMQIGIASLISDLKCRMSWSITESELDVSIETEIEDSVAVIVDRRLLLDAVEELMANALKFTSRGFVKTVFRLSESQTVPANKLLQVEVSDSGCGMKQEDLETLFERFAQADDSKTRQVGGLGIGLAVCKLIAQNLGATIDVSSEAGKGSVFTFSLPCRVVENAKPSPKLANRISELHFESEIRVLVVEDEFVNRRVVCKLLDKMGATSDHCENGQEALKKLESNSYDLILMDLSMPIMDGISATREIRERKLAETCPIVALTAHSNASAEKECAEVGMNAFLNKPIPYPRLFHTIASLVSKPYKATPSNVGESAFYEI